jgi:hypothetical protein
MSFGLTSQNRHYAYDWMAGEPKPGELEYLSGARSVLLIKAPRYGFELHFNHDAPVIHAYGSVTRDTLKGRGRA